MAADAVSSPAASPEGINNHGNDYARKYFNYLRHLFVEKWYQNTDIYVF